MKKVLIFLTAILLSLLVFDMNANEPVKKKIPLKFSTNGGKISRGVTMNSIEACYYGMLSAIHTTVASDHGVIDVTVTNCSTGESWDDTFDSSATSDHVLSISGAPGFYDIVYITESGELYEGEFNVE